VELDPRKPRWSTMRKALSSSESRGLIDDDDDDVKVLSTYTVMKVKLKGNFGIHLFCR